MDQHRHFHSLLRLLVLKEFAFQFPRWLDQPRPLEVNPLVRFYLACEVRRKQLVRARVLLGVLEIILEMRVLDEELLVLLDHSLLQVLYFIHEQPAARALSSWTWWRRRVPG